MECLHISEEESVTPEAAAVALPSTRGPLDRENNNPQPIPATTNVVMRRSFKGNRNSTNRKSVPNFGSPPMVNGTNDNQGKSIPLMWHCNSFEERNDDAFVAFMNNN